MSRMSPRRPAVLTFDIVKSAPVPAAACSPRDLNALAAFTLEAERVRTPVELTLDLTGHRRIQRLNRHFRGVDRTTDVISFRDEADGVMMGDLAINIEQAAIQAKKMRHPWKREVRLLLIHGILHLLGYTDYEPKPRRRMFKRQNELLRRWEKKAGVRA